MQKPNSGQQLQNLPLNNSGNFLQQLAEFRKAIGGKDPQAIVQNLLNTGQMSQQQFQQLKAQAEQIQSMLK
jgi:hypothetical protein